MCSHATEIWEKLIFMNSIKKLPYYCHVCCEQICKIFKKWDCAHLILLNPALHRTVVHCCASNLCGCQLLLFQLRTSLFSVVRESFTWEFKSLTPRFYIHPFDWFETNTCMCYTNSLILCHLFTFIDFSERQISFCSLLIYTVSQKKVPTFKLSVTLSNPNRFSKLLHFWKAYEICY